MENGYNAFAIAYKNDGNEFNFLWSDLYSVRGGKLKLNVNGEELGNITTQLNELEKVNVKIIDGET